MAVIKNIHGTRNLKKFVPNKIPVREKWEQCKNRLAQRLNGKTKHWERKQQKKFLILFSIGFTGLLTLSFCFLTNQHFDGKAVTVPTIPTKLLLQEKQLFQTLQPPNPKNMPPPIMDSGRHKL
ncbi:MAG: hypothetical protein DI598_10270 [Pseudopedobacter saltans]|uniref:Uncharacterized protein n=1 Tax=Pseudopedobacter saltans TaxID=151895 RepID=A0A2W5EW24_9SPHI|nr:MAG: hypothetical protein DI598_10270 [Pseudopedobacter saltans]